VSRRALSRRELLAGAAAGVALSGRRLPRPRAERPNLLFVLTDQQNARFAGCEGHPRLATPAIDGLAADGVRFARAFCATPQCDPARMSLLSGRYGRSHGVVRNRTRYTDPTPLLPELLRQRGYRTASVGKRPRSATGKALGFEQWLSMSAYVDSVGAERVPWHASQGDWLPVEVLGPVGASRVGNALHTAGWFTDQAIGWLERSRGRPFALFLSYFGPHTPITPSAEWARRYAPDAVELAPNADPARWPDPATRPRALIELRERLGVPSPELQRAILASYCALVAQIDSNLGRLLDALEALGLAERTLVVFSSDHGGLAGEHGAWTKAALAYDALLRVPLVLRWPGRLPAGRVVSPLVSAVDVAPTLAALLGMPPLARADGADLAPTWGTDSGDGGGAERTLGGREAVFAEFGAPGDRGAHCACVRTATHKYVRHDQGERFEELFDLAADPWELRNLARENGAEETLEALRARLDAWERATPPRAR